VLNLKGAVGSVLGSGHTRLESFAPGRAGRVIETVTYLAHLARRGVPRVRLGAHGPPGFAVVVVHVDPQRHPGVEHRGQEAAAVLEDRDGDEVGGQRRRHQCGVVDGQVERARVGEDEDPLAGGVHEVDVVHGPARVLDGQEIHTRHREGRPQQASVVVPAGQGPQRGVAAQPGKVQRLAGPAGTGRLVGSSGSTRPRRAPVRACRPSSRQARRRSTRKPPNGRTDCAHRPWHVNLTGMVDQRLMRPSPVCRRAAGRCCCRPVA